MRYPISKLIWAGLIIALIFLGAMFILPVVGAVLIGVFALSCLIWLSSKVFGFFQGGRTYAEDNPGDYYDASARTSIVPKKWNKTQAVDAEVIEVEEIKNILELLKKEPIKNRVLIETYIFTGARRGEIMAIAYSDIDFENATIKINKTSEYIAGEGIITKEPKTKNSIRTIYIPQFLVKELKAYRVWHNQERLLMR